MNTTKKRVAELEGAQLDWAVAKADGLDPEYRKPLRPNAVPGVLVDSVPYYPSVGWVCGGPIIERNEINVVAPDIEAVDHERLWSADRHEDQVICYGRTPLVAAMRAFVASKLGDEVEVPE